MANLRILCLLLSSLAAYFTNANAVAFTMIHRDSPLSPLYAPNLSQVERIQRSVKRTLTRIQGRRYGLQETIPKSSASLDYNEYLMVVSLGTPPFEIVAWADTGSDLFWTQCAGCACYHVDRPIFDPEISSTYNEYPCDEHGQGCPPLVKEDPGCKCPEELAICEMRIDYADGSSAKTLVASDTLTMNTNEGHPFQYEGFLFGCAYNTTGLYSDFTTGIIGLSPGPISMVSQLGKGKFSHCLPPRPDEETPGIITFGTIPTNAAVTTPLFINKDYPDGYRVTLNGLTYGPKRVDFKGSTFLDTGTSVHLVPAKFYEDFKDAVLGYTSAMPVQNPPTGFRLCYPNTTKLSDITVHFEGGDLKLPFDNFFVQIDNVYCLGLDPYDDDGSEFIYSNLGMSRLHIGYDIVEKTVSFKPVPDCALVEI